MPRSISPRDSQRSALYRAEHDLFRKPSIGFDPLGRVASTEGGPAWAERGRRSVSKAEARALLYRSLDVYGVPHSFVKGIRFSTRAKVRCVYASARREVVFAPFGLDFAYVAVHEAAHVIQDYFGVLQPEASHGPRFVAIIVRLYAEVLGLDADRLERWFSSRVKVARWFDPAALPGIVYDCTWPAAASGTGKAFTIRWRASSPDAVIRAADRKRVFPPDVEPSREPAPF